MRLAFYAIMVSLLTACTDAALWAANLPASIAPTKQHVSYGEKAHQTLDLYVADKSAPLIAFFYGGGWSMGDKAQYRFVADTLAERGYSVAVINYGLWPEHAYPDFIEDTQLALTWLKGQQIASQIIAMGHSAGAYNVIMATAQGAPADKVIGISGPYAFTPSSEKYKKIFAKAQPLERMQAAQYVTSAMPPTLLLHGADDSIVSPQNTQALASALSSASVKHQVISYAQTGHYGIMLPFVKWRLSSLVLLDDIDAFIQTAQ